MYNFQFDRVKKQNVEKTQLKKKIYNSQSLKTASNFQLHIFSDDKREIQRNDRTRLKSSGYDYITNKTYQTKDSNNLTL